MQLLHIMYVRRIYEVEKLKISEMVTKSMETVYQCEDITGCSISLVVR